ncbi:MAG: UDP-glucose 4-epimerase GalE [Actinomycetota bacterium]|nr:UDP-glucose 4-epimerase GalE [Actinomycetota bacterium]MDQ2955949.1 UDP-glucose 4-epimerase GalE [Actinomycetota bacterium]
MRVLVTGGAGYVGSVVAAELVAAGHQVTVLDDLSTGHADAVPAGARFVHTSITEADPVLAGADFEAVLHFAAKSLVAESVEAPQLYWHNNVTGSLALLESMRRHGVRQIVFSSTAATYGEPDSAPISESAPTRPTNPYGASKLAVDQMLAGYATAYGFAAVSLRYFNVAGARLVAGSALGERHATETHLIPIALQVAAGQRDQLQVNGTDYPTPDGSCVRDYIHVLDLADAHLRALDWANSNSGQLICNLGSGSGSSVREVVEAVRQVTGTATPTVDAPKRPGDPAVLVASNVRAAEVLGWRPTRGLTQMVTDAWAFARRPAGD